MIAGRATSATIHICRSTLAADRRRTCRATAASAPAIAHDSANTAPTMTPWASAASWSKAAARIARPIRVYRKNANSAGHEHGGGDDHREVPLLDLAARAASTARAPTGRRPGAGVEADEAAGHHADDDVDADGDDRDHERRPADHRPDRDPLDAQREQRGAAASASGQRDEEAEPGRRGSVMSIAPASMNAGWAKLITRVDL